MTDKAGLYLHIPFCEKKCRYCSFYSSFVTEELLDNYTEALIKAIIKWGGEFNRPIDTIYLGGGTPSLLEHRLIDVLSAVRSAFNIFRDCEITLELNPSKSAKAQLEFAKTAGINRLSIGVQSGNDSELLTLGRTHTASEAKECVKIARELGFSNISLDIMLGLPDSNCETLGKSLDFITELAPSHISAYILKIEENTAFFKAQENLSLPSDDEQAEQYLFMCEYLRQKGYSHYEISNFSKEGGESRHNLKYWLGNDYLGIGPSAHSFVDGKRFYYENDLKSFINGKRTVFDGIGGTEDEFVMLNLRLKSGLDFNCYKNKFGKDFSTEFKHKCRLFEKAGYLHLNENSVSLTDSGMLLSNGIIAELLECGL